MTFDSVMNGAAHATEAAGVLIMLVGFVVTAVAAAVQLRRDGAAAAYRRARRGMGRAILLGLELLVAADIIRTIVASPSLQHIASLAIVVAIRTFLSFALEIELNGQLPWRTASAKQAEP